jgi:hypothetical protein
VKDQVKSINFLSFYIWKSIPGPRRGSDIPISLGNKIKTIQLFGFQSVLLTLGDLLDNSLDEQDCKGQGVQVSQSMR